MAFNYQTNTICPHCNRENRPGELICYHCQRPLLNVESHTRGLGANMHTVELGAPSGTEFLAPDDGLILQIETAPEPLWLEPCRQLVLGRVHPQNPQRPDVDLGKYQGLDLGVSTRHAALTRQQNDQLMIEDLASRNGTYLNGERLRPHTRYLVHSGDHVRMGNLCLQVYFGS